MAQEDVGVSFVSSLAQITGADLAASVGPTGSVMLGGNWVRENQVGTIDADGLTSSAYSGLLLDDYAASTATQQVIMPLEGFVRAFGIQEQVINKLIVVMDRV